ncbi:MAG TPA: hypothetical protein VM659_11710 [Dongiaceae bacterium]|nr:hypothetical protein [Dongiaceae bacterium]
MAGRLIHQCQLAMPAAPRAIIGIAILYFILIDPFVDERRMAKSMTVASGIQALLSIARNPRRDHAIRTKAHAMTRHAKIGIR